MSSAFQPHRWSKCAGASQPVQTLRLRRWTARARCMWRNCLTAARDISSRSIRSSRRRASREHWSSSTLDKLRLQKLFLGMAPSIATYAHQHGAGAAPRVRNSAHSFSDGPCARRPSGSERPLFRAIRSLHAARMPAPGSLQTRCWRKPDSNSRSRRRPPASLAGFGSRSRPTISRYREIRQRRLQGS